MCEGEEVIISINYKGQDIPCCVPIERANILLNDPDEAEKYIIANSDLEANAYEYNQLEESIEDSPVIWSSKSKKANSIDDDATQLFLQLRSKYAKKFDDKKSIKSGLWQKIASEMKEAGYNIGELKDGVEKCRQKFANLQRAYFKHLKHMRTTGEGHKDPPPYFAEMHDILGAKDKAAPSYLQDSLNERSKQIVIPDEEASTSNDTDSSIDRKEVINRFKSQAPLRPKSGLAYQILNCLNEEKEERAKHHKIMEENMETQNKQRERMLNILERSLKKRRRVSDSDSDSSYVQL